MNKKEVEIVSPLDIPVGAKITSGSTWQTFNGEELHAVKYVVEQDDIDPADRIDLTAFHKSVRKIPLTKLKTKPAGKGRTRVFLFTDAQIGKTDCRNGVVSGTPEFIRLMAKINKEIEVDLKARPVEKAVIADGGDGIESMNQQRAQMFTNDLSDSQAMNLYGIVLHDLISTVYRSVTKLNVMVTPSNHAKVRQGKDAMGRAGDDYGLMVHQFVERETRAANMDITYHAPATMWEDITYLDVEGHGIALLHGDQVRGGAAGMKNWVGGKTAGGNLIDTEIVLSGHNHNVLLNTQGTTAKGKTRYWIQGAALDGGSIWYSRTGGFESPPGMVSIDIDTERGVDLSSFHYFDGTTVTLDEEPEMFVEPRRLAA